MCILAGRQVFFCLLSSSLPSPERRASFVIVICELVATNSIGLVAIAVRHVEYNYDY